MPIIVTNRGISDAKAAEDGGFLVSLTRFSVSDATGFPLVSDRDALVGETLYEGAITSIEAISRDSILVHLTIPKGYPASGQWNLTELGIWNSDGSLFAHGLFQPYPKTGSFGMKYRVVVTLARLGEVINVTVSNDMSLPSAAAVATLQPASSAAQNAILVMDGTPAISQIDAGMPNATSSPALAVKFGGLGERWSFIGFSEVYSGSMDRLVSPTQFQLNPATKGFWLADSEVVILAFNVGPASGESRKAQYNASANTFTLIDDPLPTMTVGSQFSVWRSNEAALPKRHAGIPDYMVLGHGLDSYTQTTVSMSATSLLPYMFSVVGNGGETYNMPTIIPAAQVENVEHLVVNVQGRGVLRPSEYTLQGRQIRIAGGVTQGNTVAVWVFARSVGAPGGLTRTVDADYMSTGDVSYILPSVPLTKDHLFITDSSGAAYGPADFSINGTQLTFVAAKAPARGVTVMIQLATVVASDIQRGAMTRTTAVTTAPTRTVTSTREIPDKSNTLLLVGGKFVPKSRYSVAGEQVTVMDTIAGSVVVDLMVFWYENTTSVTARSGQNTGPRWIDPAGAEGSPNKLVPNRLQITADGSPSFSIPPVLDQNHLMLFVGDRYVPPTGYVFDGDKVWPIETVVAGTNVDIICFQSVDNSGTEARPVVTTTAANGGSNVTIHTNAQPQSLIVFVDGAYRPSNTYTYNATNGQLSFAADVTAGLSVVAWSYADQPAVGKQVRMFGTALPMSQGVLNYVMQGQLQTSQQLLPFSDVSLIQYTAWTLQQQAGASVMHLSSFNPAWQGTTLNAVEFSSTEPTRRLALRSELAQFLRSDLNLADVPDKAAARANLGLANIPAVGDVLLRGNNLSDVPNKPLARDNLGITPIISQLQNNMLLKSSNLADVPNKPLARDNLGITAIIAQLQSNMLLKNSNLSDVPNKAAARANLGIPDQAAVDAEIFWGSSTWEVRLGYLIIKGGRYRHPTVVNGETTVWIPFTAPFPGGCLSVVQSTWIPSPSRYWDSYTQLCGTPTAAGFTVQTQDSDGRDVRWQGLDYVAVGW